MDKTTKESMENIIEDENGTADNNAVDVENLVENENLDNVSITLDEILEAWNPMEEHYYSPANNFHFNVLPPGYQLLGESTPAVETKIGDTVCRHNNVKTGKCWKGPSCLYYHPKEGSKDYDPVAGTKIVKVPIAYIHALEEKSYAAEDSIMEVTVVYAKHPWKFFVNCDRGWGCHCKIIEVTENTPKILNREVLEKRLTNYLFYDLNYKRRELRQVDYLENQLVAVLLKRFDKEKVFVRANVKKDTFEDEPGPHRQVKVQLLDSGEILKVNFEDVCSLPMHYVHGYPCLAYQCSLFGVSPLYSKWTPDASAYFSQLVVGKKCILTVKQSTIAMGETPQNLLEFVDPYKVELRVRCEDTECLQYHNVSELLAEKFHGILWNLTPSCPDVENHVPRSVLSLLAKTTISQDEQEIQNEKKMLL